MSVEIQWIGHASFRIAGSGATVYIDPWKIPAALSRHDADIVFVSHEHYDHCSPADVEKVSSPATVVAASEGTPAGPGAIKTVSPGDCLTIGGVAVEAVSAYNIAKNFHPKAKGWCGAVFGVDGKRIYYAGDTDLIDEMSDLEAIDVALLPVGGTYTMNASEAAKACEAIGCQKAIPYHWGDIVGDESDARKLADAAGCEVVILHPGESMTL